MHTLLQSHSLAATHQCLGASGPHCGRTRRRGRPRARARQLLLLRSLPEDSDSDPAEPVLYGDWREFRARLILGASGAQEQQQQQQQKQRRLSEDNLRLLEIQNPKLAAEETWAHATAQPERGGLLLATPDNPLLLGDEQYWQAVVLLVQHSAEGSVGLILNRPTRMLLRPGRGGLRYGILGAPDGMQQVFADNRVYCGGPVRQDVFHVLHGHKLEGAVEVVPGVFHGGEVAAVRAVREGLLPSTDFKFYCGAMVWQGQELQREVDRGAWWTAAASRPLVLKQCLQLPTPLWKEVLGCMGGEYAVAAAQDIIE